jgi:sarcosine oxidase/L-pipecolate oxidase
MYTNTCCVNAEMTDTASSKSAMSSLVRLQWLRQCITDGSGFTRFKQHQPFGADAPKRISVPRSHAKHPTDTIPDASEVSIRKAIAAFLPRFNDKELFNKALCWCTDTADAALLICEHPKWKNFILATGDSG